MTHNIVDTTITFNELLRVVVVGVVNHVVLPPVVHHLGLLLDISTSLTLFIVLLPLLVRRLVVSE